MLNIWPLISGIIRAGYHWVVKKEKAKWHYYIVSVKKVTCQAIRKDELNVYFFLLDSLIFYTFKHKSICKTKVLYTAIKDWEKSASSSSAIYKYVCSSHHLYHRCFQYAVNQNCLSAVLLGNYFLKMTIFSVPFVILNIFHKTHTLGV